MSFLIGSKVLKRLVIEANPLQFVQAKLSEDLFLGDEIPFFKMVSKHLAEFHTLPALSTVLEQFPAVAPIDVPEPSDYYLKDLETRFGYNLSNRANKEAEKILKEDKKAVDEAMRVYSQTVQKWDLQKHRNRILNYTAEAHDLLTTSYFAPKDQSICDFGWEYLDQMAGGMGPGDVISMVGRPGSGKTYQGLHIANHNVFERKKDALLVSMEMVPFVLAQRVSAMRSNLPIGQVKTKHLASKSLDKWLKSLQALGTTDSGKLYIVDGNLAATVDNIYQLAGALDVDLVLIDGAYLLKHPNLRLDRFVRVAENVELIKARTTTLQIPTYCAWQFRKDEKTSTDKKTGAPVKKAKTIDDIGYSDAIAQISSVVLGLEQPETVETLVKRWVSVLKGRDGEVGGFFTHWDFTTMNFKQYHETEEQKVAMLEHL